MISRTEAVKLAPEIIQRILHLKDENWGVKDLSAKFSLSAAQVIEILGRREVATRARAAVYTSGRPHKRHPGQNMISLSGSLALPRRQEKRRHREQETQTDTRGERTD